MLETRSDPSAFAHWLNDDLTLTPTELRIMLAFNSRFGLWIPARGIVRRAWRDTWQQDLYASDLHTLRAHISRIRRKLEATPWRIQTRHQHGLYRLVRG